MILIHTYIDADDDTDDVATVDNDAWGTNRIQILSFYHDGDGDNDWKICISAWKPTEHCWESDTALINSCYDIPRTPKVWNVLARN